MIVKEYRVLMPLTLEEYQRGQLFSVAEASKNETGGGEGVEVLKQEQFSSTDLRPGQTLTGIYTHKVYHLKSKLPWIARKLLPDAAMDMDEIAYNAFPYCKTVVTNPGYMKDDFFVTVETMHIQDGGETENALNCSKDVLKKREVVFLDIYNEAHLNKKADVKPDTDPRTFRSAKTGRGPLKSDWSRTQQPVMCCYKLVTCHFKWTGFQGKIEKMIHKSYPRLFTKFNREVFCWLDKWHDMSMEEVRKLEEETADRLRNQLKTGQVRGMCAEQSTSQET